MSEKKSDRIFLKMSKKLSKKKMRFQMKLFLFNKFQHSIKMEDFCHRYHIETSALITSDIRT